MRTHILVLLLAACNARKPTPKQEAVTPTKPVAGDPGHGSSGSGSNGSAGDPAWTKDPPDVLRDKINGVNAHVIVLKNTATFPEYRQVLAMVEKTPGVVAAEPFIFAELEMSSAAKPPVSIALKAVDPARVGRVLTIGTQMKSGTLDALGNGAPPPIILGDVLAKTLDVRVGDDVTLTPPQDPLVAGEGARPGVFRVAGTFHMAFDEYDERLALAPLPAVQALLGRGDHVMGIEMTVKVLGQSDEIAKALEVTLGGPPYKAIDWYELNEQLFTTAGHARP
ncbi:MAG: ABC transporter permease [Deltaproteobacteria bacterium]|nr:ABC transporter permease [Deltaproteobacteria bacterium]MDQ3298575.1 hypothetical protein [Myxococcota bacterium]